MRNSITHAVDGEEAAIGEYKADKGNNTGSYSGTAPKENAGSRAVYIGTNVEYAPYVELGTTKLIFVPLCGEHFAWEEFIK